MNEPPVVFICHPVCRKKKKCNKAMLSKPGPGYAIPMPVEDESWKGEEETGKICTLTG